MELGEPDDPGRRDPEPIPGSEFDIACDMVVVAIGTRCNPLLRATAPDLQVNEWGYIVIDEHGMTSLPGVFAGGDIVRGAATVILAMGDGKRAAAAIDRWLTTGSAAEATPEPEAAAAGSLTRTSPSGPDAARTGRRAPTRTVAAGCRHRHRTSRSSRRR